MNTRSLRGLALPAALVVTLASLSGCSGLMNRAAAAAGGTSSGSVASGSARLDVVNESGMSVYSMQASACSDSNWGPDRLGSSTISSGGSMSFDLTPGCWDFRADFDSDHASGNELVQRNIRIGSGSSWTWTIGG
ncbi:MAG TPA: hypothetical protein VGB53_09055 [Rubricoccaceae bacterium]|jgi:uncharacterized protein YceK